MQPEWLLAMGNFCAPWRGIQREMLQMRISWWAAKQTAFSLLKAVVSPSFPVGDVLIPLFLDVYVQCCVLLRLKARGHICAADSSWYTAPWCASICAFAHLCRSAAPTQWPQQHGDHKYPQNKYSILAKRGCSGISSSDEMLGGLVAVTGTAAPCKQAKLSRARRDANALGKPRRRRKDRLHAIKCLFLLLCATRAAELCRLACI